jgi:citrate synthase
MVLIRELGGVLVEELISVHDRLARRENLSSSVISQCAMAEKDYISSIVAGMLTYGGRHGPVSQVVRFLSGPSYADEARLRIKGKRLVPGWGSDFVKGRPDPELSRIDRVLCVRNREIWARIREITDILHESGKKIFPNAACYTASVCLALGFPAEAALYWLIRGRIGAWTELYLENYNPRL